MNFQINMLDRSEARRVEGIVNKSFYTTMGVILVAGATSLCVLVGMKYMAAKKNLDMVNERWQDIASRHEVILKVNQATNERKEVLSQLVDWRRSGMAWNKTLRGLPAVLPESVQLTRLQVYGNLEYLEPDEEGGVYFPIRQYKVKLDGRATGADGDETIIGLVNNLPKAPVFGEGMESAKLLMMQTDNHVTSRGAAEDEEPELVRTFAIEGYYQGWNL